MQRLPKKISTKTKNQPDKAKLSAQTAKNKYVETAIKNYSIPRQLGSLKPNNTNKKAVVPRNAATLFSNILRKSAGGNSKAEEKVDDDSGSDGQLRSIISRDESVLKSPMMNFTDVSSASSSSSLSTQSHSRTATNIEILNKLENMENKIDDIGRRHEKCVLLLAQANAKIDSLLEMSSKESQPKDEAGQSFEITLVAVKSLAELEACEERCKDDSYVDNVIRSMEKIHGKNRFKGNGATVCLQIVDYFVDRNFFRHCSWTGISKTLDKDQQLVQKIAFSKYERYINLFYKVVRNADEDFTINECNKFFKQCLRNSKQRLNDIKMLRMPAARKRRRAEFKLPPNQSAFEIEYLEDIIDQESPEQKENMCEVIFEEGVIPESGYV